MFNRVFLYFLLLTISSCSKANYYNDIEKCVNESVNKNNRMISFYSSEDIEINTYDSITKFEFFLLELKFLHNYSKESYIDLINLNLSEKQIISHIELIKEKIEFIYKLGNDSYFIMELYGVCPGNIVYSSKKASDDFYPTKRVYEDIIGNGSFPSKQNLGDLIVVTDFNNQIARNTLTFSYYMHLYGKYLSLTDERYIKRKNQKPKF